MTSQQILDDRVRGWRAAAGNEPFQGYQSDAWQAGWQQQREETLRRHAMENDQAEIEALLTILRHTCNRLAAKGIVAADLAAASAHQCLSAACAPADAANAALTFAPPAPVGSTKESREGQTQ